MGKIQLPADRLNLLRNTYLAHRISPEHLRLMLDSKELTEEAWRSQLDSFTLDVGEEHLARARSEEAPQELGFAEVLAGLTDEKIWNSQERAIYRRLRHGESPQSVQDGDYAAPFGEFRSIVEENFELWNFNGDLTVDEKEVDRVLHGGIFGELIDEANKPESAAALNVLKSYGEYLSPGVGFEGDGVSLLDLEVIHNANDPVLQEVRDLVGLEFQEKLLELQELGEPGPISQEQIHPFAIEQGDAGSCVLLSVAAALSAEQLKDMLGESDPGLLKVNFADGASERVAEPTLAERLYHSKGDRGDRWVAALEKAVAQRLYLGDGEKRRDSLTDAIDGVEPQQAFKILTGSDAEQLSLDEMTVAQTREQLAELLNRDGPVICATRPRPQGDFVTEEQLHNGLLNGHAYTVLDFDQKLDQVTLRNPWGHGEWDHQESPDDGIFSMPTRDFYSSFRWIAGVKEAS